MSQHMKKCHKTSERVCQSQEWIFFIFVYNVVFFICIISATVWWNSQKPISADKVTSSKICSDWRQRVLVM